MTGFKKGSVIVEFVVFLESFEKARTNLEVQNLFSQQKSGQNDQTMLGEFTLDSKFTKFSGMYIYYIRYWNHQIFLNLNLQHLVLCHRSGFHESLSISKIFK